MAALPNENIDTSDIPELGKESWEEPRVAMPEDRNRTRITANRYRAIQGAARVLA